MDASNNRIADVPNDLFRFLKDIRIVNLSRNRLRALPDNMFREDSIEHVDFSHNLIGKLPLNCFSVTAARNLYELDLSWNSISSLSHGGMLSRFLVSIVLEVSDFFRHPTWTISVTEDALKYAFRASTG